MDKETITLSEMNQREKDRKIERQNNITFLWV